MSLRESWTRIRGTLRRDNTLEREMDREIAFHLEMAAQRNVERGMTPEAAMREARLAFGGADDVRESARDATRARVAENVIVYAVLFASACRVAEPEPGTMSNSEISLNMLFNPPTDAAVVRLRFPISNAVPLVPTGKIRNE